MYRGPGRRPSLALTFDDGPSEGSLRLIEYLAAEGIRATFFQCGRNVERHPGIARAIRDAGHEIGNHTYSHARLFPRVGRRFYWPTAELMAHEVARAQNVIQNELSVTPRLFRAPYGLRWFGLDAAQKQFDLLGVMWTVIGHDWVWPADRVARRVLRKAAPGGIVCLHDGRDIRPSPDVSEMLKAVRQIVAVLKSQGYEFETVSELLRR